jgi:3-oxoadipate enol-lactonase
MDPFDHDLERGLRNRRAILGDAWVDKSLAGATAFNAEFQNLISRFAWHEVWGRPGLDAKTRRVIVLAITAALGRWEEYELHLRAALTGSEDTRLTPDEVKEVLMQTAIYAGVPAANTAFSLGGKLLRELGREMPPLSPMDVAHPGAGRSYRTSGTPALHYTVREPRHGAAPRHTLVMSHALGCDASMWDALANAMAADHRVVCHDHRGHGDSDVPPGPYTMEAMAQDAARLLDELEARGWAGSLVWVGLSLGGMVGQELALRQPGRLRALVVANSTSAYPPEARDMWTQRLAAVEQGGLDAIADGAMQRWFSESFRQADPASVVRWRRRVVTTSQAGYVGAMHAVMNVDTASRLPQLRLPTLVIAGSEDQGTPPAMSRAIAQAIPGARLALLDGVAHLSVLEQPATFEAVLREFLASIDQPGAERG